MPAFTDSQILSLVEAYMNGSDHPDQVGYRNQVADREFANKERFLHELKRLASLGNFRSKNILDVGCGFGWQAFTMALLGNKVTGLDILPSMIDGMTSSVATMRTKGIRFDLTPVCGDVCNPEFEKASFDAIYSMEAIEHVHDLKTMFNRCFDLLKPGGQIFLMNDSNVLNTRTREETVAMWQEREHSWDWIAKLKAWRPVEHGNAKPFAIMREDIIRAANPDLDDAAVRIVVENTAGLIKPEIEALSRAYAPSLKFPAIGEFDRCRNPETGEYAERLLDPFKLAGMLQDAGFKTSVRHLFHRFPLNYMNGIQFRPLNKFLFELRGTFMVVGKRPGELLPV
jgi:SAM-dependent methyltransferase